MRLKFISHLFYKFDFVPPSNNIRNIIYVFIMLIMSGHLIAANLNPIQKISVDGGSTLQTENMSKSMVVNGSSIHIVWFDQHNDGSALFYIRSDDLGATWGPNIRLSPSPSNDSWPLIDMCGSTIHLTFLRNSSISYYKRSLDGGNTWVLMYF